MMALRNSPVLLALLALAACGSRTREVERLDRELLNGASVAGAAAPSRASAARSGASPADARQAAHAGARSADNRDARARHRAPPDAALPHARCGRALTYGRRWAMRLPAAVPLPRGAIVREAAGRDAPGCRVRAVSYASALPARRLAAFYAAQGRRSGYATAVERHAGELVVAGDHPGDARAFYVTLTPRRRSGTDVDIVTNAGR